MKTIFLFAVTALLSINIFSQTEGYYQNPVITSDMADPTVIKIGNTFYATGTSSEWAPFYPMFSSTDLVNWTQIGHVFNKKPGWTSHSFWAPELYYHNNKIFCYYTARRKTDNVSFIGVASVDSPYKEFTDHGPIIEYGTESIDAFVFNDNGQLYISWKAYGLDNRPIELLAAKLSEDGLRLEGEVFSLMKDDERIGMEGQQHFKHGNYYYIIYSARGCCGPSSDYDVRVARSKNFAGPYEIYSGNPILQGGNGDFQAGGHGTLVETDDNRLFYLFHAYQKGAGFYLGRQPSLQEIEITDDNWIRFTTGNLITTNQVAPFGGTVQKKWTGFNDEFTDKSLKVDWTWNYPFSDIDAKLKRGKLLLSGNPIGENNYGTALCLRPQTTDYAYETQVVNRSNSFKGLTMYGDDKNLLVFGIRGGKLILKSVRDNKETILVETVSAKRNMYLKIEVRDGCMLTFYTGTNGKNWTRVSHEPVNTGFLVRWDRVARPGLIHIGEPEQQAEFSYFRMGKL
ncbi:MAG: family 43 glycosylhydrolase [Bacteroidia bacterium]|nr:family 43 glycosylhydrolase [Bacteroidia bacterium]